MAASSSSMAAVSRILCRSLCLSRRLAPPPLHHVINASSFSTESEASPTPDYISDAAAQEEVLAATSDSESVSESESPDPTPASASSSASPKTAKRGVLADHAFVGGLDAGIYKAILVGQVGQTPLQKTLRNGRVVTLTSIGTGGMRNERIPLANEQPREYAERTSVQWHRVAVYNETLGGILVKHAQPGSILYLEGNIEMKIFADPISGLIRRVREIAVRRNGRVVFLGSGSGDYSQPSGFELKGVGYF